MAVARGGMPKGLVNCQSSTDDATSRGSIHMPALTSQRAICRSRLTARLYLQLTGRIDRHEDAVRKGAVRRGSTSLQDTIATVSVPPPPPPPSRRWFAAGAAGDGDRHGSRRNRTVDAASSYGVVVPDDPIAITNRLTLGRRRPPG